MPNNLVFAFPKNGNANVTVSLQKTIRVPDDGKDHALPPGLGGFNYFLHEGKKVLPIGDEEALWFNFNNSNHELPVAIKILTGGINAITGEKEEGAARTVLKNNSNTKSGQNYMVVPGQPWLDGFKGKDENVVRQFVAVKLGEGRTVEEKLEGTQFGGLQIIVIPPSEALVEKAREAARRREEERRARINRWLEQNPGKTEEDYLHRAVPLKMRSMALESCSMSKSMGIGAGGKIKQEIVQSDYKPTDFDTANAQYTNLDLVHSLEFALLKRLPFPPQIPTFDQWNNAGLPWFSIPSNPDKAVKVDGSSRLADLDRQDNLSALKPEQTTTQIQQDQVIHIYPGLFKTSKPEPIIDTQPVPICKF